MQFDLNYLAIAVAAIVSFALGFVWYGVIFKDAWVKAMKLKEGDLDMERPWLPYIISFITSLAMAAVLAVLLSGVGAAGFANIALIALIIWIGFVAFVMGRNYAYANKPTKLWSIDAGYVLVEILAIALILSFWL